MRIVASFRLTHEKDNGTFELSFIANVSRKLLTLRLRLIDDMFSYFLNSLLETCPSQLEVLLY